MQGFRGLVMAAIGLLPSLAHSACDAPVKQEYCRFFVHFETKRLDLDPRVATRLNVKTNDESRSIALIAGIDQYPNIPDASIAAAKNDVKKLVDFLQASQNFDEVIVLQNADVSASNLHYFLDSYLPRRALVFRGHGRFLFAYSGHGTPGTQAIPASLVLSSAQSMSDTDNLLSLSSIRASIENLAKANFHVLTLINACYGGNVFGQASEGGNPNVSNEAGSYAVTAGPTDAPVATLGRANDGSIFFDDFIQGVSKGEADPNYPTVVDGSGNVVQRGGVVRLGPLTTYLTTEIENLGEVALPSGEKMRLKAPWIGAVEPDGVVARGAFFFLSPIVRQSHDAPAIVVPTTPSSSIPGKPEVKVFGAGDEYPIRGIDVSRYEGDINWQRVSKSGVRFTYIRASGPRTVDPRFQLNWEKAGTSNVDRGAYLVYDYCSPIADQLALFNQVVPRQIGNLPPAIDVEEPIGNQVSCARSTSAVAMAGRIFDVADKLRQTSGKVPIVYGNRRVLGSLSTDPLYPNYMIWLASYSSTGQPIKDSLHLSGRNPWTLWQYSASSTVPGIGANVDRNAFFGTEAQYTAFKAGLSNVALSAVVAHNVE